VHVFLENYNIFIQQQQSLFLPPLILINIIHIINNEIIMMTMTWHIGLVEQ